jgi:hypothetical protein
VVATQISAWDTTLQRPESDKWSPRWMIRLLALWGGSVGRDLSSCTWVT